LHHPFEAIDMTSSLNQKFITYLVNAEGNCYSLKSTVPNILMRTNILQNSLSALKSRISKDCAVKMLTCRSLTCRRHGVHTIDTWNIHTWNKYCHWRDATHVVIGRSSYGHTWTTKSHSISYGAVVRAASTLCYVKTLCMFLAIRKITLRYVTTSTDA